jgi:protein ImuA
MGLAAPHSDAVRAIDDVVTAPARPELEALRARIAAIEKRPPLAAAGPAGGEWGEAAEGLDTLLAPPPGLLHEIYADELRQSGVALGFTLGLARQLLGGGRRALIYLQLAGEAQELGLPYGLGLARFGLMPDTLVLVRPQTPVELLWALEEAIACRAVAGVIADVAAHPRALDFTASRRLSLRTAASGTTAFLIRYGTGREASAAKLRWHVRPSLSAADRWDPAAPGLPRLEVEIEKRRLGSAQQRAEQRKLIVDWTENGFVAAEPPRRLDARPVRLPAPSRPFSPALGDRLSEAG